MGPQVLRVRPGPPGTPGGSGGTVLSGTADGAYGTKGQLVLEVPGFGSVRISRCEFPPDTADPSVGLSYERTGSGRQRIGNVGGSASETAGAPVAGGDRGSAGAIQVEDVASRRVVTITGTITSDAQGCHAFAQAVGGL